VDAVASALTAQCPLRDVEVALATHATEVIPELNRLTALTVELPR
jgi:hypothetical protein